MIFGACRLKVGLARERCEARHARSPFLALVLAKELMRLCEAHGFQPEGSRCSMTSTAYSRCPSKRPAGASPPALMSPDKLAVPSRPQALPFQLELALHSGLPEPAFKAPIVVQTNFCALITY